MARDGTRLPAMAWRNIWRNRRRTLITLSSIGFGTALAILMTAVQDAQWRDMIDVAARLGGGHVTLQHTEYLDTPTLSRSINGTPALRTLALEDPHVDRVTERITGFLMLSTAAQSYGAAFIAFLCVVPPINLANDDSAVCLSAADAMLEGVFDPASSTEDSEGSP